MTFLFNWPYTVLDTAYGSFVEKIKTKPTFLDYGPKFTIYTSVMFYGLCTI